MMTVSQIATPPSIAVGFLCQRSILGLAIKPKRRANARTSGVSMSARQNDAATASSVRGLKGIGVRKLCHKKAQKAQNHSLSFLCFLCLFVALFSATDVVVDDSFEDPINVHLSSEADKLSPSRNGRYTPRHVLKSLLVSLVVRL